MVLQHASFNAVQTLMTRRGDGSIPGGGRPDVVACTGRTAGTADFPGITFFDNHARWMLQEMARGELVMVGHEAFARVNCPVCKVMMEAALEGRQWRALNPSAYPEVAQR